MCATPTSKGRVANESAESLPRGWHHALLDSLAKRGSGHTPDREVPSYWDGGIKWVSLADCDRLDRILISETTYNISRAGIENSSATVHPSGAVIVSRDAGVGKSAITKEPMAVSQHFIAWICGDKLNNLYLYYWLQWKKPLFERMAVGSTIKTLGLRFFEKLALSLPKDIREQERIAEAIKSTDESIFAAERLISAKSDLKRGLLQEMLSGKRRFSQYKKHAWRSVRLSEIVEEVFRPVAWQENHVYRLASVRRWSGGVFAREELVGSSIKVKKLHTIHAGDFLISHIQSAYGAMALVPPDLDGAKVSELYTILQSKSAKRFDIRFLAHLSATPQLWHMAMVASNGFKAERLRLNFDPHAFLKQQIPIPVEITEQRLIADTLDAIEAEVVGLAAQVEALTKQKLGLMQNLLTGRVRLKIE